MIFVVQSSGSRVFWNYNMIGGTAEAAVAYPGPCACGERPLNYDCSGRLERPLDDATTSEEEDGTTLAADATESVDESTEESSGMVYVMILFMMFVMMLFMMFVMMLFMMHFMMFVMMFFIKLQITIMIRQRLLRSLI